jgi:hypothetical protein
MCGFCVCFFSSSQRLKKGCKNYHSSDHSKAGDYSGFGIRPVYTHTKPSGLGRIFEGPALIEWKLIERAWKRANNFIPELYIRPAENCKLLARVLQPKKQVRNMQKKTPTKTNSAALSSM